MFEFVTPWVSAFRAAFGFLGSEGGISILWFEFVMLLGFWVYVPRFAFGIGWDCCL